MNTIPIEQAQATLAELIRALAHGERVTITEKDRPIARLSAIKPPPEKPEPQHGRWLV